MDTATILEGLTDPIRVPVAAIAAARERRDEIVPVFIDLIEGWTAASSAGRAEPSPLFFALHLLAEFRAKQAYRPLAQLLSCDGGDVTDLLGDAVTETLPGIVVSVFDGDPAPLQAVIESPIADEFVRSRSLDAFAALAVRGDIDRGFAAAYLRALYDRLEPQDEHIVWEGWQGAVAMLGLSDLAPLVETAFDRLWVPPGILEYKDFLADLERAKASPGQPWQFPDEFEPIDDTADLFAAWHGFSEQGARERERRALDPFAGDEEEDWSPMEPVTNPYRHVGRNDPCPCGSGKKFKKCCLSKAGTAGLDIGGDEG